MVPHHRNIVRAICLRSRLGQKEGGTVAPFPKKPKLMRWHTYLRLRAESMALDNKIWDVEHAERKDGYWTNHPRQEDDLGGGLEVAKRVGLVVS